MDAKQRERTAKLVIKKAIADDKRQRIAELKSEKDKAERLYDKSLRMAVKHRTRMIAIDNLIVKISSK